MTKSEAFIFTKLLNVRQGVVLYNISVSLCLLIFAIVSVSIINPPPPPAAAAAGPISVVNVAIRRGGAPAAHPRTPAATSDNSYYYYYYLLSQKRMLAIVIIKTWSVCWAVECPASWLQAWTLAGTGEGRTAWPDPATVPLHAPWEGGWTLCQDFYVNFLDISTLSPFILQALIHRITLHFQSSIFNHVFKAFSNAFMVLRTSVEDFICMCWESKKVPSFPVCSVECPGTPSQQKIPEPEPGSCQQPGPASTQPCRADQLWRPLSTSCQHSVISQW